MAKGSERKDEELSRAEIEEIGRITSRFDELKSKAPELGKAVMAMCDELISAGVYPDRRTCVVNVAKKIGMD